MSKSKKTIQTTNIQSVGEAAQDIGDSLSTQYYETGDIKTAQAAISAYNVALSAAKIQLVYGKITGELDRIPFLER